MSKPSLNEYATYFQRYIDYVEEDDLRYAFEKQTAGISDFLTGIPVEKENYAYAPGKWTIKEVLQHIIDAERIFNYRALCAARGEKANLPGFEEDDYATNSFANERTIQNLTEEFLTVRKASEMLFYSFTEAALSTIGTANNNPISALSLGFITVGHYYHHKKIMQERYL